MSNDYMKKNEKRQISTEVTGTEIISQKMKLEERMYSRELSAGVYAENDLILENRALKMQLENAEFWAEVDVTYVEREKASIQSSITRNKTALLYNDKRNSKDSPEMTKIKNSLLELDGLLRGRYDRDNLQQILSAYEKTDEYMQYYIDNKNPFFADGKRRKNRVIDLQAELKEEKKRLVKQEKAYNKEEGGIESFLDLLEGRSISADMDPVQEKIYSQKRKLMSIKRENGKEDEQEMFDIKNAYRDLGNLLRGVLAGDDNTYNQQLDAVRERYQALIDSCNTFLDGNRGKTENDRMRAFEISKLRKTFELEAELIGPLSLSLKDQRNVGRDVTWLDAWYEARQQADAIEKAKPALAEYMKGKTDALSFLSFFAALNNMERTGVEKHNIFLQHIIFPWAEESLGNELLDNCIALSHDLNLQIVKVYNEQFQQPVPAKFLKNPDDDPKDPGLRKAYTNLVLRAHPLYSLHDAFNAFIGPMTANNLSYYRNLKAGEEIQDIGDYRVFVKNKLMADFDQDIHLWDEDGSEIFAGISDLTGKEKLNTEEVNKLAGEIDELAFEESKKIAALFVSKEYFDYSSQKEQELKESVSAQIPKFDLEFERLFDKSEAPAIKKSVRSLGFDDFVRIIGSSDAGAVIFENGEFKAVSDDTLTRENRELRTAFMEACLKKLSFAADAVEQKKLEKTFSLNNGSVLSMPLPVKTIREIISEIHEEQSEVARVIEENKDVGNLKSDESGIVKQRLRLALAANDCIGLRFDSFALMSPSESTKKALADEINKILTDAQSIGMENTPLSPEQIGMLVRGNVSRIKDEIFTALTGICALARNLEKDKLPDHGKLIHDNKLMTRVSALVIRKLSAETEAGRAAYEFELNNLMALSALKLSKVENLPQDFDPIAVLQKEREQSEERRRESAAKKKETFDKEGLGAALKDMNRLGADMSSIVKVLLAEKFPSELIRNDKESSSVENLLSILKGFKQGEIQVKDFTIRGNQKGRLVQRENGSLEFISKGVHIPIPFTAQVIADRIETDMAANVSKYDSEKVKAVIDGLVTESEDSGITTRSRNICLKALFSAGNIPSAFFNNVSLSLLKIYAGELLSDNITAEQIKQQVMELENKQAINGEEALSLLKQMEARRQDVAQKVQFISHDNVVNEQKDDGWAEDERKVKNLLADMIYSEDTWTYDETLETGDRMQKMMIKNIDAWILLFKDKTLLDRTLDKMPLPGSESGQRKEEGSVKAKEDLSIKGQIRKKFGAILALEQVLSRVAQIGDDPQAMRKFFIKLFETEMFKNAFSSVEEGITEAVNEGVKSIQEQIANLSARIFTASSEVLKDPAELPDPNEKGIELFERENRKKAVEKASEDKLRGMMESALRGNEGQGKFMKLVLNHYFDDVDIIEKKSMLASAIRSSAAIVQNNDQKDGDELKSLGQYLGGFLKGAGPLLQKMLQGLPDTMIPPEIQGAINDMKSNLAPIPKEIVEAQLVAMVERSKGKITKIEVSRSLGAASVGQAFLCKMYGKGMPKDGEEVVVKLLRPDVRNRMMREKEVMLKWADKVDNNHGQMNTYLGQLSRIEEELDLTVEAANIEKGRIYDKMYKTVKAVKVNPNVEPTVNSLVLTKASGITVDKYLDEVKAERLETISKFHRILNIDRQQVVDMIGEGEDKRCGLELTSENAHMLLDARKKMGKLLERLEKRKRYLMELSEIWVSEGIYGEGYYHGDLHAGNIMFDDNGLTVIDFGNATKLSSTQQEHVTRMMLAAAAGDMGLFRHGFHMLLENTPENIYQQKREALGRVFEEVFSLGNKSSAGYRVAVALLKAQELGIELPAAINNFSSGQIRLQNSIDSMNQQIRSVRNELMDLDTISYQIIAVDPVAKINVDQHFKLPEVVKKERVRFMKELRDSLVFARLDFIEKLKGSSRAEQVDFEKEYLKGYKLSREAADTIERNLDTLPDLRVEAKDARIFENRIYAMDMSLNRLFMDLRKYFPAKVINGIRFELLDTMKISYAHPENDVKARELVEKIRALGNIVNDYEKIRAEQKKESPDDALLDQMIDSFAAKYERDFEHNCTRMGALEDSRVFLNDSSDYTKNAVATELQMWFDDKKNFGEALKKTFEEFRASKEKGEPAEVILQKEDAFIDIYRKAVIVHLNEMISECSKEVPSEPIEDFCDVMGSVIDSNLVATLSRLSFFKAFMLKRKIEA